MSACLPAFTARLVREGAAAARLVNELAMAEVRRRGDAWRAAGLGPFATLEAVHEAGLEA